MAMVSAVQVVEKYAAHFGVTLTPKEKRRLVRQYRADRMEIGSDAARTFLWTAVNVLSKGR